MAKKQLPAQKAIPTSGRKAPDVRLRWLPPFDILLASTGVIVSVGTLVFTSPLLAQYWFPPGVEAKIVSDGAGSVVYDLSNTGWSTARQVIAEFDTFSTVTDITLRPEAGAVINKRGESGFSIMYPSIGPSEVFKIFISYTNPNLLAEEFGAVGLYNLRSDAGEGTIHYDKVLTP